MLVRFLGDFFGFLAIEREGDDARLNCSTSCLVFFRESGFFLENHTLSGATYKQHL